MKNIQGSNLLLNNVEQGVFNFFKMGNNIKLYYQYFNVKIKATFTKFIQGP